MLHIKKGDKVIVLSGDDKGKTGKVLQIFPKENRAIVEGINMVFKHKKPRSAQEAGGITKTEAPIYLSKLQVVCPECGAAARMGFVKAGEEKSRVCKKCSKAIDTKEAKKEKTKTTRTKKTEAKTTAKTETDASVEQEQAKKTTAAKSTTTKTAAKKTAPKKEKEETTNNEA